MILSHDTWKRTGYRVHLGYEPRHVEAFERVINHGLPRGTAFKILSPDPLGYTSVWFKSGFRFGDDYVAHKVEVAMFVTACLIEKDSKSSVSPRSRPRSRRGRSR